MKHDTPGLVALPGEGCVGVLESGELLFVALAFTFELFGYFLLQN